jgi:hypothetical protein
MADLIAFILEIYLDIQYWIKYKKRRKFEKENNLQKSIVWHPMTKPLVWFFLISLPITSILFFFFGKNSTETTIKKINEISVILESEKKQLGKYPKELKDIIRNNPLRSKLETDVWGNSFIYQPSKNLLNYRLVSLGKDKKPNTSDDISFSSN